MAAWSSLAADDELVTARASVSLAQHLKQAEASCSQESVALRFARICEWSFGADASHLAEWQLIFSHTNFALLLASKQQVASLVNKSNPASLVAS